MFDAKDVDSPTVSLAVVNMLLQMAADLEGNWAERVVDVADAYMNVDLKTTEFMRIPANIASQEGSGNQHSQARRRIGYSGAKIEKKKKALYGLCQASSTTATTAAASTTTATTTTTDITTSTTFD